MSTNAAVSELRADGVERSAGQARSDYIVFGRPLIGEAEIAEVVDSLRAGWLGTGPKVARFEGEFAAYIGAPHAVAVSSCTAALFLTQLAAGIGPGDSVITTPLTFVATANAVYQTGAVPLFADVEPHTGLLDPRSVERLIEEQCTIDPTTGRPRHLPTGTVLTALLPVHLWGQPADMVAFRALADRYRLTLIEDAAHAIEAFAGGEKVGTTADASCFSFYSTKNVCTGEGGMVTTADPAIARRVRALATHGLSADAWKRFSDSGYRHYLALEPGWKFNMMDLQAALGIHQLAALPAAAARRRAQWLAYLHDLADLPGLQLPAPEARHGAHARHLFVIELTGAALRRDEILNGLHGLGVGAGVHYLSLRKHPAHRNAAGLPTPIADSLGDRIFSVPLGGALLEPQRKAVVRALRQLLA